MYRWGERDNHSYVIGAFNSREKAEKAAWLEWEYRGGMKYCPEIIEVNMNRHTPGGLFEKINEHKGENDE